MAEFLNGLLGAQGCQVDGSMGLNPVNQMVDHFLDGINSMVGVEAMSHFSAMDPQQHGEIFYGDDMPIHGDMNYASMMVRLSYNRYKYKNLPFINA